MIKDHEIIVLEAGAVVVRDVAPGSLVSGVPAKARPRNCNASLSE
jgi:acetyltransferase-like isoleucine patch superfamily enzyme